MAAYGGLVLLVVPGLLAAQELPESEEPEEAEAANEVAVFLGDTRKDGHDTFTIGLDYERRLSERHGVGFLADWAATDQEREFIAAVPYFYHPPQLPGLKFIVAPGLEFVGEDVEVDAGEGEVEIETEHETLFLVRIGAGYAWELGRFIVGPQVNWDLVDGPDAFVFGVSAGIGF